MSFNLASISQLANSLQPVVSALNTVGVKTGNTAHVINSIGNIATAASLAPAIVQEFAQANKVGYAADLILGLQLLEEFMPAQATSPASTSVLQTPTEGNATL